MLVIKLQCQVCQSDFTHDPTSYMCLGLVNQLPRRCPKCNDERQHRPQVVVSRWCDQQYSAVMGHTAARVLRRAQPFTSGHGKDVDIHEPTRLLLKGRDYGADWEGRVDIWCHVPYSQVEPGTIIQVRDMVVTHKAWFHAWKRQTRHGITSGCERIEIPAVIPDPVPTKAPVGQWSEDGDRWISPPFLQMETTDYVAILPYSDHDLPVHHDLPVLVFGEANTKTTLKGYGLQYSASIEGGPALWEKRVRGGVRSGRASTSAILALQYHANPLRIVGEGDRQYDIELD